MELWFSPEHDISAFKMTEGLTCHKLKKLEEPINLFCTILLYLLSWRAKRSMSKCRGFWMGVLGFMVTVQISGGLWRFQHPVIVKSGSSDVALLHVSVPLHNTNKSKDEMTLSLYGQQWWWRSETNTTSFSYTWTERRIWGTNQEPYEVWRRGRREDKKKEVLVRSISVYYTKKMTTWI